LFSEAYAEVTLSLQFGQNIPSTLSISSKTQKLHFGFCDKLNTQNNSLGNPDKRTTQRMGDSLSIGTGT
jgi:hypothetical protein